MTTSTSTYCGESARDFLAERGEKDSVKDLAAMDWTGLLVDERLGGAGWRPVEACVIAEELGRARDSSAWLGTAMAAAAVGVGTGRRSGTAGWPPCWTARQRRASPPPTTSCASSVGMKSTSW